jgi:hypothetical protein
MTLPTKFLLPRDVQYAWLVSAPEYKAIVDWYGDRRAGRSQVPLINHIHEGIVLMRWQGGITQAKALAWCIHPFAQIHLEDGEILTHMHSRWGFSGNSMDLAMLYARVAGAYLPRHKQKIPTLSVSQSVNEMLIVDKIQNRRDFMRYHNGVHPNSRRLEEYFEDWFIALAITEKGYDNACRLVESDRTAG